ncbi:hypothetical protein FHL15_005538 [Xylaria flabelliformis]|uniref:Uncharacterized protein n=1 Tax=Xylaria flabelliformis TaxID=2512241 RepID=A0A553I039_9PEZI|nr:hypothetical protein FHL15_005538 [Xylaria flabelliformis]
MPLQIPHPTNPLHLYRHILRESTYLPALCRTWITSRIQQRFRDCRRKNPPGPYMKQAHSSLQYLRSVNAGDIRRLERLCFMATGRIGKRRRILTSSQLGHRPPTDTAELELSRVETTLGSSPTPDAPTSRNHDWLDKWSFDMIAALAQSQLAQQAGDWPFAMRRTLGTKEIIEGRNSFDKPYKPKLIRNKLKKHWVTVFKQLLPPLPQGEWDHLASLVKGEANVDELIIPRRTVARSAQDSTISSVSETWDWSQHVLKPARVLERGSSRNRKTLTGKEDQDPRGPGRPIGTRVITPRALQRIYGHIWNMSPIMKKNPNNQKWSVSWGEHERRISTPSTKDLIFFQGVTQQGHVLPKKEAPPKG